MPRPGSSEVWAERVGIQAPARDRKAKEKRGKADALSVDLHTKEKGLVEAMEFWSYIYGLYFFVLDSAFSHLYCSMQSDA